MPDEPNHVQLASRIVGGYLRHNQVGADQLPVLIQTVHHALLDLGGPAAPVKIERTPAVPIRRSVHRDYVVCLDCGWKGQMLRRHIPTAHGLTVEEYRSRWNLLHDHALTTGLLGTAIWVGEAAWPRSRWTNICCRFTSIGIRRGTRADTEAAGTTANGAKLIPHGGIGLFTMPEAGLDSLLVYGITATIAHFLMSLGQTLFHRHLGHSRLGGRFFKNHIQFHHVHYSGDHVVSTSYLDDGDNNTLFFVLPVAVIVGLSYFILRFDLFMVQLAAMFLSFCGHYYIDNQYHVVGSWLGRFSWFRGKQQLHFTHHRHGNCNFAVIDFFWDQLLGTYRRAESGG